MDVNISTIYIRLLDEVVLVHRPTRGKLIRDLIFEVLPTENYDLENEEWEFPPGKSVRCVKEFDASLGREILIAIEEVDN